MRVLIVNNGKKYPARLVSLFPTATVEVVKGLAVKDQYPVASHDLIILSGSNDYPIPYFHDILDNLLAWIPEQTQPLLGICYGAELIVEAYGGTLHHLGHTSKRKGFYTYDVPPNTLDIPPRICVYEAHQWIIESVSDPLQVIIPSAGGVLMFEHSKLSQIGTIFHPEKFSDTTDGLLVFSAILRRFNLFAG